jgi:hypothetical protein
MLFLRLNYVGLGERKLLKRIVSGIMLSLLVISTLALAFNIQPVKASGTIYIRADGSIDLSTATIQSSTASLLSEPPPTEWNQTYGGAGDDWAASVVQTTDGGYAFAGSTLLPGTGNRNFWLVKTDPCGTILWDKTYGGADYEIAYSMVQTSDGGYALAGITLYVGGSDFWLVKTDADGNIQWSRTYGGTNDDRAYSVVQTSDGGYAITGYTASFGAGWWDFWLVKTNSFGGIQWTRTYGGTSNEEAKSVIQTSDGGYAIAGSTASFGAGFYDFWLIKTDSAGNIQWNKTYGGADYEEAHSMVQTSDGGYAIAGRTWYFGTGSADSWLVKTDAAGNMEWNKTYGGADYEEAYSMVQTSDGGYALAGEINFGGEYADVWLVKTDSSGTMLWNGTYGGVYDDRAYSVVQTSDGGYALAGFTYSFSVGSPTYGDAWLIKLAPMHDVAITDVTPSKTIVGQGYSLNINVTVENQGDYTETFNVTLYANTTFVALQTITLESDASTTLTFTWNTTGFATGNYIISAIADTVPGETDTEDNTLSDGWVFVTYVLIIGTMTPGGNTTPPPFTHLLYWDGTPVTVTATSDTHWVFAYWILDGINQGAQNPITITMNRNHLLHAIFNRPPGAGGASRYGTYPHCK